MKADLYLFNSSFIDKDEISLDVLRDNLKDLQKTIQHINEINAKFQSEKDQVFKYDGIYEIVIFKNTSIGNFLYGGDESFRKLRDEKFVLREIVGKAEFSSISTLRSKLNWAQHSDLVLTIFLKFQFRRFSGTFPTISKDNYRACEKNQFK